MLVVKRSPISDPSCSYQVTHTKASEITGSSVSQPHGPHEFERDPKLMMHAFYIQALEQQVHCPACTCKHRNQATRCLSPSPSLRVNVYMCAKHVAHMPTRTQNVGLPKQTKGYTVQTMLMGISTRRMPPTHAQHGHRCKLTTTLLDAVQDLLAPASAQKEEKCLAALRHSLQSQRQPFRAAHRSTSKCPCMAAIQRDCSLNWQTFRRQAHSGTDRWPP